MFEACVHIGAELAELHLGYEHAQEYPLRWLESKNVSVTWGVEKMRFTPNKDAVVVNEWLTLAGVPPECFEYRLGNRSALEWVLDQYQIRTDARSGITSNPNRADDEEYIVRLVGRVVTVSVETVRLVRELAQVIAVADWMDQQSELLQSFGSVTPRHKPEDFQALREEFEQAVAEEVISEMTEE